ncbi:energy transducer TonB [Sphingomonas sp. ac-8]|uniref:energy transducer TonB n=1 Tax=Sphingomonas sp. ac-8 TaxID=3242977 RepID=UPI003A7F87C3
MGYSSRTARRERLVAAGAVAVLHGIVGLALVTALAFAPGPQETPSLRTFDVAPPAPPPPPAIEPAPRPQPERGAAAPANRRARPTELVAPPPVVPVPAPIAAAPIAGTGSEAAAGAAPLPGPGTGAGGVGEGTGSGTGGTGTGSGGGRRAILLRGAIRDSDYPRAARRARVEGSVTVRFTVGTDGSATGCRIARSSGSAELDTATCRLIETRYRYAPARDAAGRAVAELRGWRQDWWLEPRGG